MNKRIFIALVLLFSSIALFAFCHSTPQRVIRSNLLFHGYKLDSFKTKISKVDNGPLKGRYYCEDPAIGLDFYVIKRGFLNLLFIDTKASGGA